MKPNLYYSAGCLFRLGWVTLLAIVALALLKHFVFDIMPVSGQSMFPNFHDRDVIVLNKISYVVAQPIRGDSVVLRFPGDPNHERYIKRIIGMPGEHITIKDGQISINGIPFLEAYLEKVPTYPATEITLKENEFYLMGDNRGVSSDSRIWGAATKTDFIGKALFIIYPFNRAKPIPNPLY